MDRICIACKQTDDHPRHIDGETGALWHMDCHVLVTGCEVCASQIEGADGAIGDALRLHLTTKDG